MNGSHLFLEEVQELEAEVRGTRKLGDIEGTKESVNCGEQHSGVVLLVSNEGGVVVCLTLERASL